MKPKFPANDTVLCAAVGADEHGGADWAAGVPAHEGVDGEPGRGRGGHHPPHLLLHPGQAAVQVSAPTFTLKNLLRHYY